MSLLRFSTFALALFLALPVRADHLIFSADFAPTENPVNDVEKPARDAISLNGSWQFQPQDLPEGTDPHGHPPDLGPPAANKWDPVSIKIPSPWNVNGFSDSKGLGGDFHCYPSYPAAWNDVKRAWLRRTFQVPDGWKGKRVILHFNAVAGQTVVLVNGRRAGDHFDLFLPFEFDITSLLKPGDNELLVGVQKASLFDAKGAHGRAPYQVGSMWGIYIAGIWQDVYLEAVPAVRIADVFVQPDVAGGELRAQVTLRNDSDSTATLPLAGQVRSWQNTSGADTLSAPAPNSILAEDASLTFPARSVIVPSHGMAQVTLRQKAGTRLKLWSPDTPNLYGLVLNLGHDQDVKYTRFGWRQFTFRGRETLLNGQPIVFKGDAWHFMGIPELTRRYAWSWCKMLKDAGGNCLRLHAEPYPSFFLDVADEMGVCVLDETAVYGSNGAADMDSPAFWSSADREVADLVRRDRDHPCVMGWSVCNEMWAFVAGIYHSPPSLVARMKTHYAIWAETCRSEDPTHPWISADGDGDGLGQLPVTNEHYQGDAWMKLADAGDKPWAIGEQGSAYFATPEQVARFGGENTYVSIEGRMKALAIEAYQSLGWMETYHGNYRSIFNLAWYGLQPLALGQPDTGRAPTPDDGVFFEPYVENKFGVQPERLGPYCTTFNPGYDPNLPLYQSWPFWSGISDGFNAPTAGKWPTPVKGARPPTGPTPVPPATPVTAIDVLAGPGGKLGPSLQREGVVFDSTRPPDLLFVDGAAPPDPLARPKIDDVLTRGGTVFIWGITAQTAEAFNALLPVPLQITDRQASSLVPVGNDPLIAGIKPSDLYFSELDPWLILDGGLDGPLVARGTVLLQAPEVDWRRWNGLSEAIKTASVLRSEREAKPSGVALLSVPVGRGRLVVCQVPSRATIPKRRALIDALLTNLGVSIPKNNPSGDVIDVDGDLTGALVAGAFPVPSYADGFSASPVDPASGASIRAGADAGQGRHWMASTNEGTVLDFRKMKLPGPTDLAVAYLSFWVFSPRALDDLLVEPNVPKLDLDAWFDDGGQIWLNGKSICLHKQPGPIEGNESKIPGLTLQKGWNHFLVKVVQNTGQWQFKAAFHCDNQPDFINSLHSALEKPAGD